MRQFTDYKNADGEEQTIIADGGKKPTSYRETAKSRQIGNYKAPANNPAYWATLAFKAEGN